MNKSIQAIPLLNLALAFIPVFLVIMIHYFQAAGLVCGFIGVSVWFDPVM